MTELQMQMMSVMQTLLVLTHSWSMVDNTTDPFATIAMLLGTADIELTRSTASNMN